MRKTQIALVVLCACLLAAKGDIYIRNYANGPTLLPVGADGLVLIADSAESSGMRWGSGGSGAPTGATCLGSNGTLQLQFGTETGTANVTLRQGACGILTTL